MLKKSVVSAGRLRRQIFALGMACRFGRKAFAVRHGALPVSVSLSHARINREALTADQALSDAAYYRRLEQLTQQIAIAETAVAVLGEG